MTTDNEIELNISPRTLSRVLFGAVFAFVLLAYAARFIAMRPGLIETETDIGAYTVKIFADAVAVNVKSNITTFFISIFLLSAISGLFFVAAKLNYAENNRFKRGWLAFGLLFLYLSLVRSAILPEKTTALFAFWTDRDGWFNFRWEVAAGLYLLIFIVFHRFILHFEGRSKYQFIAANLMYFFGAFGVELFNGRYASYFENETTFYTALTIFSLLVELAGLALLILFLLRYFERNHPEVWLLSKGQTADEKDIIRFNALKTGAALLFIALSLGALSLFGQYMRFNPEDFTPQRYFDEAFQDIFVYQFSMNTEANLSTHYNSINLLFVAVLFYFIATLKKIQTDRYRLAWLFLFLMALYFSMDEQAVLHERLNGYFENWTDLGGWLKYKWVIPGIAGVVVLAFLFVPFFFHLDYKFKALFLISAFLYFGGALGSEIISGRYASLHGSINFVYSMLTLFEEMLEISGIVLLIYSQIVYLESKFPKIRLTFRS